jgi:hypothetical protein
MFTRRDFPLVLLTCIGCLVLYLVLAPVLQVARAERYGVPSQPADFAPVVADLMSGRLQPDSNGFVVLPHRYSALTITGRAFVERRKDGQVLIFFPTTGLGREGHRGYLYHNQPLSKADTFESYQGYWLVGIVTGPVVNHERSHLRLEVGRKVSRHWYYVRTPGAPSDD